LVSWPVTWSVGQSVSRAEQSFLQQSFAQLKLGGRKGGAEKQLKRQKEHQKKAHTQDEGKQQTESNEKHCTLRAIEVASKGILSQV